MRELEAAALALTPVIAAAIAKAVAPLNLELAELRKCLADRPMPVEPDLEAIAALVKLPEVKDGEPGKDAAEVDLDELAKAVLAMVEIPVPENGKDAAEVDLAAVAALVEVPAPEKVDVEAIARAAAALIPVPVIPEPEHGRDAIDLEILPAIDEAKQYPRGTYAAHRGGLWKSYERTHGLRGWECIVDGIDAVNVTQDAVREFSVTLAKSSGAEVVQKFKLPIQVYQGVYQDEKAYDQHDNVTWGGSQWTSTKAENTDKPGTSDAWTLVVKAGRPGKDLRENASTFDASKGVKI
jgi:hypothetical protein